ncbi:MAG: hypothetical protein IPG45_38490 [Deltaproteobacteria bacterium]|jgi:hypothetical protein|nr:hypothetical protein [Deltaproteobacteria bacterium]
MSDTNIHPASGAFRHDYSRVTSHPTGYGVDVATGTIRTPGGAVYAAEGSGHPPEPSAINPYPWAASRPAALIIANLRARGGLHGLLPGQLPVGTYDLSLRNERGPERSLSVVVEVAAPGTAEVRFGERSVQLVGPQIEATWNAEGTSLETTRARRGPLFHGSDWKPVGAISFTATEQGLEMLIQWEQVENSARTRHAFSGAFRPIRR